jgi:hypothetical protein
MIIHLNEHKFGKLFLTESTNSKKAHRQTREAIAQDYGKSVDDPYVIETEQAFEKKYFGEGRNVDWFITLEPYAYKWFSTSSPFEGLLDGILGTIKTKAETSQNRVEFMKQVKSLQTFNEIRNFVGDLVMQDRIYARQNKIKPQLNQNYQVLGPLSYNESNEYGKYSGVNAGQGGGQICYTTNTYQRQNYSDNEKNSLYLLLRNDWKEVSTEHDGSEKNNGLPEPLNQFDGYDDYGLSMIFVWITPQGSLYKSNTRWNHNANYGPGHGVDDAFTEQELEQLMGAPFETIFNVENFYDKADAAQEGFMNGKSIEEVFDSVKNVNDLFAIVTLNGKYNIFSLTNNKLVYPHDWFDRIEQRNNYGDLKVKYGQFGVYYFDIDGNNGLLNFYDFLAVIAERLVQGKTPDMFFNEREYFILNKLNDFRITDYSTSKDMFFDGRRFAYIDGYSETILDRLRNGYDMGDIFYNFVESPLGYLIVEFNDKKPLIFNNEGLLSPSTYYEYAYIFNKAGHTIFYIDDESTYFDGERFYDIDGYSKNISQKLKDGVDARDLINVTDEGVSNFFIATIPVNDYSSVYNVFDSNANQLVSDRWFDRGVEFSKVDELPIDAFFVYFDGGYGDSQYNIILNNQMFFKGPSKGWPTSVGGKIKIGTSVGVEIWHDEYCNVIGELEDGSFGLVFNNIDELPYEIESPSDSNEYAIVTTEYGTEYMIPGWKIVSNEEFVQYINESLDDGEYLSAFGEWEDINDIFGYIKFADGGYNIVDRNSKENRLMLNRNVYGGIMPFRDQNMPYALLIQGHYKGESCYNVMRQDGTLLIDTQDTEMWPEEIHRSHGGRKPVYVVKRWEDSYNIINENGEYLLGDNEYYSMSPFYNGICVGVKSVIGKYFIDEDGNVLNKELPICWYERSSFESPSLSIPIRCEITGRRNEMYFFSKTDHKFYKEKE